MSGNGFADFAVRSLSLVAVGWGLCLLYYPWDGQTDALCDLKLSQDAALPRAARNAEPESKDVSTGLDLDFVEIGTSNFETLIQLASDESKGLSVEGLKMYQDQLPDKPHVQKVNAAISNPQDGVSTIKFYYIHPDDVKKHRLPPWLVGCNAAGKPQTEAARILKNRKLEELMRVDEVPVFSFAQLVEKYNVRSIGYLKVDVEGHEPIIFRSMIEKCKETPSLWPRVLKFEHKHIKAHEKKLVAELKENRYVVAAYTTGDHRDYTMVRIA